MHSRSGPRVKAVRVQTWNSNAISHSSINDYNEVISLIAIQEDGENLLKFFWNVTFLARLESSIQARNSSVYVDSFMAMKGKDFVGKAPRQNAVLETEVPTVLNYLQYLSL